jgi:hypothetical protein
MKRLCPVVVLVTSLPALNVFVAQTSAPPAPSGIESRLERALKYFPGADTDKDGKLSMEEALKYVEAHPELKDLIGGLAKGKAKGPGISKPGALSTPESAGLPAGPRVFVCAHSFMIFTGQLLPAMTEAAGIAYRDAGRQMIGGSRTIQHWNVPDEDNLAKKQLREGAVDVLTVSPHMLIPDEGIDNFAKLGLEKNPNLRVFVQASWPARDGASGAFNNEMRNSATIASLRELQVKHETNWVKKIESQVTALNTSLGKVSVFVLPVGRAVFALRERIVQGTAPGLTKQTELFRDDLGHPNSPLSVLVTYCHFAAIHGKSPVGLPVPQTIKDQPKAAELNLVLQQIAWDAVTNYPMSGVKAESVKAAQ